jgi:hypothetical protein
VLPGEGAPLPPPIPETDTVELWILQAPVWEFLKGVGNITMKIHLIHTAIGVVHKETGDEFVYEFEGVYESPNATFPYIINNSSAPGGKEVKWCNDGAVCFSNKIDWPYYLETKELVAVTNGTIFNKMFAWLPVENDTNSVTYYTFGVYPGWNDNGNNNAYLTSYTCDDFAWRALGLLTTWGVQFYNNTKSLKRDYLNFYVSAPPQPVNQFNGSTYQSIASFYDHYNVLGRATDCSHITDKLDKEVCEAEVAAYLFDFLYSSKFLMKDNQYYWLDQKKPEGFNLVYQVAPIIPVHLTMDVLEHIPEEQRHMFADDFAYAYAAEGQQ